jgi:hypothetical protein
MAEIPLEDLKVGDHVVITTSKPPAAYVGKVKLISKTKEQLQTPGTSGTLTLTPDGEKMSISVMFTTGPEGERQRAWKVSEDPVFIAAIKDVITKIAESRGVCEDVQGIIEKSVGTKGGRRRKTRKTRKARKTRRA